jgi:ABC-type tungstate transport system permease subunit
MELCNAELIKSYIKELNKAVIETPSKKIEDCNVHSSSGYSPDVADNQQHLKHTTALPKTTLNPEKEIDKGMEKIKNFGTITISEGEDEGTKLKKRTITKETFIRNEKNFKRQNTQIGKQSRLESQDNIAKGKDVIQSNKPFNTDYRRGVNDEVTNICFSF